MCYPELIKQLDSSEDIEDIFLPYRVRDSQIVSWISQWDLKKISFFVLLSISAVDL